MESDFDVLQATRTIARLKIEKTLQKISDITGIASKRQWFRRPFASKLANEVGQH